MSVYNKDIDKFVALRRELHQIPEPGFAEIKTQQFLLAYIATLPTAFIEFTTWRTGILVKLKGKNPRKTIGYRTDMDGLPIKEETGYEFRSQHEGYMHACGHDLHMAIALGILTYFTEHRIDDDLLFVFQPAEEGPGGAKPMMESAEFKAWKPDQIYALHIAPEYPVGTVATKTGALFAAAGELEIEIFGRGGHAARPHQANDALLAAAHLVTQLSNIITKNIDPLQSAVVNIGKLTSGTRGNIVANHAHMAGTVRAFSHDVVTTIKTHVEKIAAGIEEAFGCKLKVKWSDFYAPVINAPSLTRNFMDWVERESTYKLNECPETLCGEDFGFFLEEIPGMMFWLGVDCPAPLHHGELKPDERAIEVGIDLMVNFISKNLGLKERNYFVL